MPLAPILPTSATLVVVMALVLSGAHAGTVSHCDEVCGQCNVTDFDEGGCMSEELEGALTTFHSTRYTCDAEVRWCTAVAVFTNSQCSGAAVARINPVCNMCQYDWEADSFFRLDCDLDTHHLDFREGCDPLCRNCTGRSAFPFNSCHLDQSAGDVFLVNEGLYKCSTFQQSHWTGPGCIGSPVFTHTDSQNHCDGGTFVTCGPKLSGHDGILSVCSDGECGQCNSTRFANKDCNVEPALDGMQSYTLKCNEGTKQCPGVRFYDNSECSGTLLGEVHPVCNQCQWDYEAHAWFLLDCDETTHHIDFREGCDATCTNCSHRAAYPQGACQLDQSSGLFIVNEGLEPCTTFTHRVWQTSRACHGEPTYSHEDATTHCDDGMTIVCGLPSESTDDGLSKGTIAAIVVGSIAGAVVLAGIVFGIVKLTSRKAPPALHFEMKDAPERPGQDSRALKV